MDTGWRAEPPGGQGDRPQSQIEISVCEILLCMLVKVACLRRASYPGPDEEIVTLHVLLQRRAGNGVALEAVPPQLRLEALRGLRVRLPLVEENQLPLSQLDPVLVDGEGLGGDDGHPVPLPGHLGEVDLVVAVGQAGRGEGGLPHHVVQAVPYVRPGPLPRPAVRELHVLPAPQQEVQDGALGIGFHYLLAQGAEGVVQDGEGGEGIEPGPERVQEAAEDGLGVRPAHGIVDARARGVVLRAPQYRQVGHAPPATLLRPRVAGLARLPLPLEHGNVPVVREDELDAPELPLEGMDVLQAGPALGPEPDVRHHVVGFDRVSSDEGGDGRVRRGAGVVEGPHPPPLVDGEAPSVGVDVGVAPPAREAPEREREVRGGAAVHAKELAGEGRGGGAGTRAGARAGRAAPPPPGLGGRNVRRRRARGKGGGGEGSGGEGGRTGEEAPPPGGSSSLGRHLAGPFPDRGGRPWLAWNWEEEGVGICRRAVDVTSALRLFALSSAPAEEVDTHAQTQDILLSMHTS